MSYAARLGAACCVVAGIGLAAPAVGQAPAKIRIAVVPSVPAVSTYLALDKGYFRQLGLEAEVDSIDAQAKAIPFLATNQVQIAQGGLSAGSFNAAADGMPIIIALEAGSSPVYHNLLLRPELAGKVKTITDLKGLRVAVNAPGTTNVYEVGRMLESVGLSLKDVDVKYLGFPAMGAALANGGIDAANEVAPFTDLIVEQKIAVRWIDPGDYVQPQPVSNLAYAVNTDWVKQDPERARKAIIALARAGREYCQAYHHGPNRAEVVDAMVRHGIGKDRELLERMDWQSRDPNGIFNVASILDIQDFFLRQGDIKQKLPAERLVDTAYAEAAAKTLGPFEVINKSSKLKGCGL